MEHLTKSVIEIFGLTGDAPVGAVSAFNRLRDIGRPSRRTVHDIARDLLAEHG